MFGNFAGSPLNSSRSSVSSSSVAVRVRPVAGQRQNPGTHLSSSLHLGGGNGGQHTTAFLYGNQHHDRCAEFIKLLLTELRWPPHKVSLRLNVPIVTVEECSRTGQSSELIRNQLCHWLKYSGEAPSQVSAALVAAVIAEGQRGGGGAGVTGGGVQAESANNKVQQAAATTSFLEEEEAEADALQSGPFASLDPRTRAHFNFLRKTVGNNFASVLSDPNDPRMLANNYTAVTWDWLGNAFTETFVEGGAATPSGPVKPESVQDLLQLHPVTKASFQPYLEYVSKLYNANRVEVQKSNEQQAVKSAFHKELERMGLEEEAARQRQLDGDSGNTDVKSAVPQEDVCLPWPEEVPMAYFDEKYSIESLLRTIPAKSVEPWQPPTVGVQAISDLRPKLITTRAGTTQPSHPKHLHPNETYASQSLSSQGGGSTSAIQVGAPSASQLQNAEIDAKSAYYLEQLVSEGTANEQNVELCLITHVLNQSEAFFEASKSFGRLSADSGDILKLLHNTRVGVMSKGEDVVSQFLTVLRLERRRARLEDILGKLRALNTFCDSLRTLGAAQRLSESAVAQSSSRSNASQPQQQHGGDAVTKITAALTESLRLRFSSASSEFLSQLTCIGPATAALLMSKQNAQEVIATRGAMALHPSEWATTEWDDIGNYLIAAKAVGALPSIVQQYQQDVCEYVWAVVATVVVGSISHAPPQKGHAGSVGESPTPITKESIAAAASNPNLRRAILNQSLSHLKTPHFIAQISDVVNALQDYAIQLVTHMKSFNELLTALEGTHSPQGQKPSVKDNVQPSGILDESAVGAAALQSLQVAIIEVLESKENETALTTFSDVETLMRVCFAFANDIEGFFGFPQNSQTRPYRATLITIARTFFKNQHERQQEKMIKVLEHEQWIPNESVEQAYQRYCNHLCSCDRQSIEEFMSLAVDKSTLTKRNGTAPRASTGVNARASSEHFDKKLYIFPDPNAFALNSTSTSSNNTTTMATAVNESNGFMVPNSLLILLQSLHDYDRYLAAFPFLAQDIVMRIHDALKLYDGQCAGLVLGAGAVEFGALAAITVAHLALASQCSGFLAELTPRLQKRLRFATGVEVFPTTGEGEATSSANASVSSQTSLRSSVPPNAKVAPFLAHLDRVGKDLEEHRREYMAKVAAMVRDRVDSSLWIPEKHTTEGSNGDGQPQEKPQGAFDPTQWATNNGQWVMSMLKETARIIKHIKPVVRPKDQQGIVVPVLSIVINKIVEAIRSVPKEKQPAIKEAVMADLALLKANVEKFGYDVVQCASIRDVKTALAMEVKPSSETEFYNLFFG